VGARPVRARKHTWAPAHARTAAAGVGREAKNPGGAPAARCLVAGSRTLHRPSLGIKPSPAGDRSPLPGRCAANHHRPDSLTPSLHGRCGRARKRQAPKNGARRNTGNRQQGARDGHPAAHQQQVRGSGGAPAVHVRRRVRPLWTICPRDCPRNSARSGRHIQRRHGRGHRDQR